jgi:hypothetical protein
LFGQIKADETFIGGKARYMHKNKRAEKINGTGGKDKTAVMGILERAGISLQQSEAGRQRAVRYRRERHRREARDV